MYSETYLSEHYSDTPSVCLLVTSVVYMINERHLMTASTQLCQMS